MHVLRTMAFTVAVAMAVLVPVGASVAGAAALPFTMVADPAHGVAGDQVEVTATSCVDPSTTARLVFTGGTGPMAGLAAPLGEVAADGTGSFTTSITVPQQLRNPANPNFGSIVLAGDYQIVAVPVPDGHPEPCIAAFHVDRTVTLPLTVSPSTGPAGSTVEVSGSCFLDPTRSVSVHAEVDGAAVPGTELAVFTSAGPSDVPTLDVWTSQVSVPTGLADGTVVSFVGTCTAAAYVAATFVVAAAAPTAPPGAPVTGTPALTG